MASQVAAAPGLESSAPVGPFLDGVFPNFSPGTSDGDWVQEDYYSALSFVEPIRIIEHPIEARLIIVGKDGKAWSVTHAHGADDKTLFFDISSLMQGKADIAEGGISDLAFHPEFGNNGSPNASYVYISYRWAPGQGGVFHENPTVDGYNRLSRFTVANGRVDLGSELVMMNQYDREQWHIGMDLEFGRDGFLYISAGDEGNCCDRLVSTQRLDGGLWSGIMRVDVDQDPTRSHPIRRQPTHPEMDPSTNGPEWPESYTQGYFIPNSNPFLDEAGGILEEFYSIGLRHPWTISFDELTGELWVADVGQNAREEINLVRKGDNHQWGYKEGTVEGLIPRPAEIIGTDTPPIWDYDRETGKAVIGAGVYRGAKFPELYGKYLFSDFMSGRLWTATPDGNGDGYDIEQIGELTADFPNGINSYLMDSKGDILLARTAGPLHPNGKIQRLVRSADSVAAPEPPAMLSGTGAFSDLATLTPRAGCIPYDLITPFWSDAALKYRWMCVPNDGTHDLESEQIKISPEGDWEYPVGSVLIKHFEVLTEPDDVNSARRIETRFLVHGEDRHYGVTYRWLEDGSDAELLLSAADFDFTLTTANGPAPRTWEIPARNKCLVCHGAAGVGVLGPKLRQLNRDLFYPSSGLTGNQVETLYSLGMLQMAPADFTSMVVSTAPGDACADIEARARSYLDANCGYCHRPNGVRANFDARLTTPLTETNLVNGTLLESTGAEEEAVVVPGDLERSVLYRRANSAGEGISMPPLAKALVDEAGMAVLADWIDFLATGDPNAGTELCDPNADAPNLGGAGLGGAAAGGATNVSGGLMGGSSSLPGQTAMDSMAFGHTGGETGGCACRTSSRTTTNPSGPWTWWLAAISAVLVLSRRRNGIERANCSL